MYHDILSMKLVVIALLCAQKIRYKQIKKSIVFNEYTS